MPITFFAFFATYDHCVDTSLLEKEAPQPELLFPGAKVLGSEKPGTQVSQVWGYRVSGAQVQFKPLVRWSN